jgi:hypothetical protein
MKRTEETTYEKRFVRLASRVEKWMAIVIVLGFVLLVGSQFLLTFDSVRHLLVDTVKLEGIASP